MTSKTCVNEREPESPLMVAALMLSALLLLAMGLMLQSPVRAEDNAVIDQPLPNGSFSDGLAQWQVELAAATAPAPRVEVINGAARIERGSAFLAGLAQSFEAPEGLVALRLKLVESPLLTADGSFVPDAFDVHLSSESGLARSTTIRPGASAAANQAAVPAGFNLGDGVTLVGNVLRIPVAGVTEGERLTLSMALVGAGRDTASSVTIDDVVMEVLRKRPPANPDRFNACGLLRDRFDDERLAPRVPRCWTRQIADTGQQVCLGGVDGECPVPGRPGQDAEFGVDALAALGELPKLGAGPAGFDYSKLDASGELLPDDAPSWRCVVDNRSGLIWEVKLDDPGHIRHFAHTYSWRQDDPAVDGGSAGPSDGGLCEGSPCDTSGFVDRVNLDGLCGASDWRLPSRTELATLIHAGTSSPAMAIEFFPNTGGQVWTWTPAAANSGLAWRVDMDTGEIALDDKAGALRVRLVREIR
ncbi:Lcl C-terminal domain-containing protein [Wenzhouxiangella marina]|uniref:Fibronectin type III domain protein n=1 Tax=Wenzhouxiangella marina TaxID=1579979 RepID=A0A0K0XVE1_9GAMM|nr:DUF1566 domain-containing protein [Wenzhouxiangella marina]AKS41592.1 Fibronectin type III domain protein [Wenzhouxiangella marina]MBB6086649.1 hypothetical protein [Wenzhouxiangella marina]